VLARVTLYLIMILESGHRGSTQVRGAVIEVAMSIVFLIFSTDADSDFL
jgi:hypothetical protein